MTQKSIAIIGAGLGGLAAGIFGQLNGYRTAVFEQHIIPGGQCTGWKRKGYTFDACIHHLFGCSPASPLYSIWEEVGAAPRDFIPLQECVSVLSPQGKLFRDCYDIELLQSHMNEMAPGDHRMIRDYISGIRSMAKSDAVGQMTIGSRLDILTALPGLLRSWRWLKPTMAQYGERFADPFMRRAMPLLVYGNPDIPLMIHLVRHAYGINGALQWPAGGALDFARSIAARYTDLGGRIHYKSKVVEILTRHGKAAGVKLEDGTEHAADIVVSNGDGRRTINDLLGGRFVDEYVKESCKPSPDEMGFAVQVFLGVNRDLSREPSSMIMLFDEPIMLANRLCHEMELQTYGFDPSMAPAGKGVIKVELTSQYSYWRDLAADRSRYLEAKHELADKIIELLERRYFSGLRQQVEVVDVSTLLTWERYTGGTMGLGIYPNRKVSVTGSVFSKAKPLGLPGLDDFYFAGTWSTAAGALFMNALSGKRVVQHLCSRDGKPFASRAA
jgi:phytoene dehydrogenase-like protein